MHSAVLNECRVEGEMAGLALHDHLSRLDTQALIAEAELTPKPGLVDRRGPGVHTDLSLELLRKSAIALQPHFSAMAYFSVGRRLEPALREELAMIGRDAERAMYNATGGSNAHKGAIWILGLLVAAAAREDGRNATEIAAGAGAIARLPDRKQSSVLTHGELAKLRYGVAGARGEACNNFPHIVQFGLPALRGDRAAGLSEEVGRLNALFSIMAHLDDTCILYRGGMEALTAVKNGARAVLAAGGSSTSSGRKQMCILDEELLARHVSPGGSADLLAATIFLDAVERRQMEVLADQSEWFEQEESRTHSKGEMEEVHGAA
jgi:triphosphoribosyl-dephospho-CoA synthase